MKWLTLNDKAVIPTRATQHSAGYDITSTQDVNIPPHGSVLVPTGIAWEQNMISDTSIVGFIWPRSGLAVRHSIDVGAGVIDSDYTGEIKVLLRNTDQTAWTFLPAGTRIAQMVVQRCSTSLDPVIVYDTRDGGFGSTGE